MLLLLALVSVSLVLGASDVEDSSEKIDTETVVDANSAEEYSENSVENTLVQDEVSDPVEEVKSDDAPMEEEKPADESTVNEDTVDIDVQSVKKSKKGKYYNYDDYFLSSAIEAGDQSYNWNGKLHRTHPQ